jgi:protein involved in polysaccharide export with SLBB domain
MNPTAPLSHRCLAVCLLSLAWCLSGSPLAAQNGSAGRPPAAVFARPGDRVVIQTFQVVAEEARPADTMTVNERGEIVLPRIGVVDISAVPISAVPDTVRGRYARILRNPAVDVLVLRRIAVNGEVRSPDIYYLDSSALLADAIARAGGINDAGNRGRVSIVRRGQEIRVPDWDKPNATNTELLSGDLVVVGRKSWFVLNAIPAVSTVAVVTSILISIIK